MLAFLIAFWKIRGLEEILKKTESFNSKSFQPVPTKGIEPSHPCEWQILSLLRLPIPPHGLF